ncbi:UNVERIFIED_CONTAM: hypothetical protein GTU68_041310 [Idotea baltica]|nr:hypothetical protein [Idotea baltica]
MSFNTEIFLNINSYENRIAIKENNNLKEIFIERDNQKRVVGNIYKGKIIKVLPGMQAAFVDIGLEKAGFLHLSEVLPLERDDEDNDFRLNKLNKEDINKWLREQTEAMITIDINTGGFTGTKNLEETIFKTNLEATKEIAKQLRLRNLGGIIIIDFIDMMDENNKAQVLTALKKELELDKAKTTVSDISELGLVEMTRKRVYESLSRTLCQPCKSCNGKGTIKTLQTICYDLFREIQSEARNYPNYNNFLLISSEDVIKYIEKEESVWLAELELELEKNIHLKIEKAHLYNQYDIIPLN